MELGIIVAVAEDSKGAWVIGKDGDLPWRTDPSMKQFLKEDMKHFQDLTSGNPVIMGRFTYESLPPKYRPLPGRENIVVTSKESFSEKVEIARTLEEAIEKARRYGKKKVNVIGGERIYREGLNFATAIELTKIHQRFEGDTYFPKLNLEEWREVSRQDFPTHSFIRYER